MRNAEWIIKNGMSFENLHIRRSDNHYYEIGYYVNDYDRICNESKSAILNHGYTNDKDVDVVLRWLQSEHHEPILDDAERRYLSAVIRPFRDKVLYIAKRSIMDRRKEHIYIDLTDDVITLPCFMKGTMYKGMKADKEYTPKELGI